MATYELIRKLHMDCPLCDKVHDVEERRRTAALTIKGDAVEYEEIYCFCANSGEEENEFETGKMTNDNLLRARNAYRRKHGLLTSQEIVALRESYGLSQVDLARLLGWGEATIARYESKAIQDEAYDNMLRIIRDDPLKAMGFLDKNRDKFSWQKLKQIRASLMEKLDSYGREFLTRQALQSEYVRYAEPSDSNGYRGLDIDKLECMVSYFAERISNLYKVKLMKLLWYADALRFQSVGVSMTGLVYRHEAMGALPVGHYTMMNLENINVQEEEGYDAAAYHIYPNSRLDMSCLTGGEQEILDRVIGKFGDFTSREIVQYMHEERAYTETAPGAVIPFSLAGTLRAF